MSKNVLKNANDNLIVVLIDENKETLELFKTNPRHAGTQHWERACSGTLESCQNNG